MDKVLKTDQKLVQLRNRKNNEKNLSARHY